MREMPRERLLSLGPNSLSTDELIAVLLGRGVRGLPALSKTMKINALTPAQKAEFKKVAIPAAKKLIVSKLGPEGEAMLKAFLEAIEKAK